MTLLAVAVATRGCRDRPTKLGYRVMGHASQMSLPSRSSLTWGWLLSFLWPLVVVCALVAFRDVGKSVGSLWWRIVVATTACIALIGPCILLASAAWKRVLGMVLPAANPYGCPVCGYDIRMTPHRCPECGTPLMWGQLPSSGSRPRVRLSPRG